MTAQPARRGRPPRNPQPIPQGLATAVEQVSGGIAPEPVAPPRPELRAAPREEDSRARAKRRAQELREHGGALEDGEDKFFVDKADQPDGWEYEWKMRTVLGKEDPAYQVRLARSGWEPVPASRHPHYMPVGWQGQTIERDGMILMERPKEISDEARARDRRAAALQMRSKEEQLNHTPEGTMSRTEDPRTRASIKKSYEAGVMPIPE